MRHDDFHTADILFDIASALLDLCREQNSRLAQMDALNEEEASALKEIERRFNKLTTEG